MVSKTIFQKLGLRGDQMLFKERIYKYLRISGLVTFGIAICFNLSIAQTKIAPATADKNMLADAISSGDIDEVRRLLETGVDVNETPVWKMTKLYYDSLVKNQTEIAVGKVTPLYLASLKGETEIVKLLLEAGAEVKNAPLDSAFINELEEIRYRNRAQDHRNRHFTANGDTDEVKLIPTAGPVVNNTPLFYDSTIQNGGERYIHSCTVTDIDALDHLAITVLTSNFVNVGLMSSMSFGDLLYSNTALHIASQRGHAEIVKHLLDAGAEVNARGNCDATALINASRNGHTEIVELLLGSGADVNTEQKNKKNDTNYTINTPLISASEKGHTEIVKMLLDAGAKVNIKKFDGTSALIVASQNGHTDIVKMLLDAGAKVNNSLEPNSWDMLAVSPYTSFNLTIAGEGTPLILASQSGHADIVKILLDAGAKVNAKTVNDWTPLMLAAEYGHTEVVRMLLDAGAKVNAQAKNKWIYLSKNPEIIRYVGMAELSVLNKGTPLMLASREGHAKIVKMLLGAGAKVNAMTSSGRTSLMLAAENGHVELVKLLLDSGAKVDSSSDTASLNLAARGGHSDIVKLLLDAKAKVNSKSKDINTAIYAAAIGGHTETVKLLRDAGAEIDAKSDNTEGVLIYAAEQGKTEGVKLLLQAGVDVNARNKDNETALFRAAHWGRTETVNLLLKSGADIKTTNNSGQTALHIACQSLNNRIEITRLLLEAEVDVNAEDNNNDTALIFAAARGHTETVNLLLEAGADIEAKNNYGLTALHSACMENRIETAKLLLDAGADVNAEFKIGGESFTALSAVKKGIASGRTIGLAQYLYWPEMVKLLKKYGAR